MNIMNVGLKENSRDMCPNCYSSSDTNEVGSNSQYICYDNYCTEKNGDNIQFFVKNDSKKEFPYDQIFPERNISEFYKKSYVV